MCNMPKVHQGCIECEDYPEVCKGRERAEDCPEEDPFGPINLNDLEPDKLPPRSSLSREEAAALLCALDDYIKLSLGGETIVDCDNCILKNKTCHALNKDLVDKAIAKLKILAIDADDLST